jgi:uncharacterized protein with NRDE domain
MCLIVLAWRAHPDFPLVVAANRDEFHARPAAAAEFWSDHPEILAGRDLTARGTWMGVSRNGRFAAVTNYRGGTEPSAKHSRGALVTDYLNGKDIHAVDGSLYSGFNLLATDGDELWWMSNRDGSPRQLGPGVYGLGNLLLESPEVEPAKQRFRAALDPAPAVEPLFSVLAASKILHPQYGTRCSTILLREKSGRTRYAERAFGPDGSDGETRHFEVR